MWLDDQEFEFKTLKTLLTKNLQTNHFDSTREVHLLMDTSRHFGIGFALLQYGNKGEPKIITCGSKSLTDTQRRYATIKMNVWQSGGLLISATFTSGDCRASKFQQIIDHWKGFFSSRYTIFQIFAYRDIESALRPTLLQ